MWSAQRGGTDGEQVYGVNTGYVVSAAQETDGERIYGVKMSHAVSVEWRTDGKRIYGIELLSVSMKRYALMKCSMFEEYIVK